MKRSRSWFLAALVLVAATASVALADVIEVNRPPAGPPPCYCPAIWEPVACRAADGSVQVFSNGCVAGCNGFTDCARVVVPQ